MDGTLELELLWSLVPGVWSFLIGRSSPPLNTFPALLSYIRNIDLTATATSQTMKTKIAGLAALAVLCLALSTARAEDKEVTVTGMGKCAKCSLKETDKCQNVIEAKEE